MFLTLPALPSPQALFWMAVMAVCPRPAGTSLLSLLRVLVLGRSLADLPFALKVAASACQVSSTRARARRWELEPSAHAARSGSEGG